jgi:hypothetical protein
MGKYSVRQVPPPQRPWDVHPIWRSIGCLLVLIGPPLAYAAGHYLVEMNFEYGWLPVPSMFRQMFVIPYLEYALPHALASLIVAVLLLLLGFAVVMIVYSAIYAVLGPSRYGPLDSPPIRQPRGRR